MNENYEFTGRVQKLEQRQPGRSWLQKLAAKPNFQVFDVEFSPAGQVLQQTDYTYTSEIYRVFRQVYDYAERLRETVEYDAAGAPRSVTDYEYLEEKRRWTKRDSNGVILLSGEDEYVGGLPTVLSISGPTGKPKHVKFFEYYSRRLARAESRYFGSSGELAETQISTFDTQGRIIENFGLTPDGRPNGDGRYRYEYDANGLKARVLSYNDLSDEKHPNHVSEFKYEFDEHGNWIERTEYGRFVSDSTWKISITTRKLSYYDLGNRSM